MVQPTSLQGLVGCIFSILSHTQDVTRAYWVLKFQRILSMRHFPLALAILFALYTRILDFVSEKMPSFFCQNFFLLHSNEST